MTDPLRDPRAVDLSHLKAAADITGAAPERLAEKASEPAFQLERWGSVWSIGPDGHVYRDGERVEGKTETEMLEVLEAAIASAREAKRRPPPERTVAKPISRLPSAAEIRQARGDRREAARATAKTRKQKRRAQRKARKGTR